VYFRVKERVPTERGALNVGNARKGEGSVLREVASPESGIREVERE
jgi:hypothetical protein